MNGGTFLLQHDWTLWSPGSIFAQCVKSSSWYIKLNQSAARLFVIQKTSVGMQSMMTGLYYKITWDILWHASSCRKDKAPNLLATTSADWLTHHKDELIKQSHTMKVLLGPRQRSLYIVHLAMLIFSLGNSIIFTGVWPYLQEVGCINPKHKLVAATAVALC